jgi:hypothetical protein
MPTPAEAIRTYILAKDGNRPFLMREVFAENAELEVVVKTDAISFPGTAKGLGDLENILVRRFGIESENVYTFCLSEPSGADRVRFQCHWGRNVLKGYGRDTRGLRPIRLAFRRAGQGQQAAHRHRCHEDFAG